MSNRSLCCVQQCMLCHVSLHRHTTNTVSCGRLMVIYVDVCQLGDTRQTVTTQPSQLTTGSRPWVWGRWSAVCHVLLMHVLLMRHMTKRRFDVGVSGGTRQREGLSCVFCLQCVFRGLLRRVPDIQHTTKILAHSILPFFGSDICQNLSYTIYSLLSQVLAALERETKAEVS